MPWSTWLKDRERLFIHKAFLTQVASRVRWGTLAELGLIVLWATWVGRAYLNLDPNVWPIGGDFPLTIQPHFVWRLLPKCGACIFWNGLFNGGMPFFAELHGAVLHPLVVITTLVWGAINGAKIAMVASLLMAGIAQWWLAKVMRLSLVSRLWVAGMAVVGGHLAGRMEMGLVAMVLSTAAGSLILAPALELALTGSRRAAIWLGITLALALMAGQGYVQTGILFGLLPAFLVFILDEKLQVSPLWREFAVAIGLAMLLSGVLWVPAAHFWPNFAKHIDTSYSGGQPIEYTPFNLVISDVSFYRNETLGKILFPAIYMNYIGWVPILLALLALRFTPREHLRVLLFHLIAIALIFWLSSDFWVRLLASRFPDFMAGVRYPPLTAGLAVPLILNLAAWGLDGLLKLDWPELSLTLPSGASVTVMSSVVVLAFLLLWGLKSAYGFSQIWLRTQPQPPEPAQLAQALSQFAGAQWVSPPYGEHFWTPAALALDLKITGIYRPWFWKGREVPPPLVEAVRPSASSGTSRLWRQVDGLRLLLHPENEYAFIDTGAKRIPCRATALGGNIDVYCESDTPGTLVVRENQWSGWKVRRDGTPVPLGPGQWLNVAAPAGAHHYEFRYRPWDVMLGILLTLAGIVLTVWLWVHTPQREQTH